MDIIKRAELVPENTDFTVDDVGWDWSNSPIATADEMLRLQKEPLYFTIRPNYGSLIDKNREYYDASWAFFQRILNNEVIYSARRVRLLLNRRHLKGIK